MSTAGHNDEPVPGVVGHDDELVPGVVAFDHEADVGIDVRADSLAELFHRAAEGMLALIEGGDDGVDFGWTPAPGDAQESAESEAAGATAGPTAPESAVSESLRSEQGKASPDAGSVEPTQAAPGDAGAWRSRAVALEAGDVAELLAQWLRELLFLYEVEGFAYGGAAFEVLNERGVCAAVRGRPVAQAIRELKGVTYHGLDVRRRDGGWNARVIFDV